MELERLLTLKIHTHCWGGPKIMNFLCPLGLDVLSITTFESMDSEFNCGSYRPNSTTTQI